MGPLPLSRGFTHLTCIDRFTRWPEAIPMTHITAELVAEAFVSGWVSWFGTPSTITTDRGGQFESALWAQLTQMLGSRRIRTTSYHPIANGLVKQFHRQLKTVLEALTPNGTVGYSNSLQKGPQLHGSRVGLWDYLTTAWRVFHNSEEHRDAHRPQSLCDATQICHATTTSGAT